MIPHTALENALASLGSGTKGIPLTGPVARGDASTIEKHLQALDAFPSLRSTYCLLGEATVQFALERSLLSKQQAAHLSHLFEQNSAAQEPPIH